MTAGWSKPALQKYLGPDKSAWRAYDAAALIEDGHRFPEFLVDQGRADGFLDDGLRPWLLEEACAKGRHCTDVAHAGKTTTIPTSSSRPSWTIT